MEEIKNDTQQEANLDKKENFSKEEVKTDDKPVDANTETEETEKCNNDDVDTEPSEVPNELLNKIRKQVEFYFGDVNMQRDKFLIEQSKLDNGWIPMTIMLNFKMLSSLSKSFDVILKALENSDLIEVSVDKKKIRRTLEKPLPIYDSNYKKAQESRTIYLKGFPLDITIETLKSHFESVDSIEAIIMRKYKKGKEYFFKGSIFLQFKTLDDAKAFIEQESIKYKDTELIKLWSVDYTASKEKERDERRQKKIKTQNTNKSSNTKEPKHKNNIEDKIKLPKGCLIHISNIHKNITKDEIKQKIIQLKGEVAYVEYKSGDIEGWIRLQGENSAIDLLKKLNTNVITINDCDINCKLLEGEEEEAYLTKIQENMVNHRLNYRDKGRNSRKGFKRRHSPSKFRNTKQMYLDPQLTC
ncbi:PREDICTED: la protein homolog [Ceratosolen solmsi marchali]|uniref:La protein homolog n=1 Tax=Ceratosolen solmsi marchali TaxID=326594 RepID=A0AAJ7E1E2_9HYME|nr:PREDICTED: la protein homolog [Ceratosolen solmsi marchali]